MSRGLFGGKVEDFAVGVGAANAAVLSGGVVVTFWTARTGGIQLTDLQTTAGGAITSITTSDGSDGRGYGSLPEFYGPPWVRQMWASAAGGARQKVVAQGLRMPGTVVVAANGSGVTDADYICDGTADEVQIQAAIDFVLANGGGTVQLSPGTFNLAAPVRITGPGDLNDERDVYVRGAGPDATTLACPPSLAIGILLTESVRAHLSNFGMMLENGGCTAIRAAQYGRTNFVVNPNFETDAANWGPSAPSPTLARSTAQAQAGTASLSITASGASAQVFHAVNVPVIAGSTYTLSGYVRPGSTLRSWRARILWHDSAVAFISSSDGTLVTETAGAWTRISVTATAPANAAFGQVVFTAPTTVAGEVHYLDSVLMEESATVDTYFDGSTSGYAWNGTANASTSEATSEPTGWRSSWFSSFSRLQVAGPWTGLHTGWGMDLGGMFRYKVDNIEIAGVGNGIKLRNLTGNFNSGDATFDRCFVELRGNNGIAYSMDSAAGGQMNQVLFSTCHAFVDAASTGTTAWKFTGSSCHIRMINCNVEQFATIMDIGSAASDIDTDFVHVTLRNGSTLWKADGYNNRLRCGLAYVEPGATVTLINDTNGFGDKPNVVERLDAWMETGSTANNSLNTVILRDITHDGPGNFGTVLRTPPGAIVHRPIGLTDAATIATNAKFGGLYMVTLAANRILGAPTNPAEGQVIVWRFTATGATRTLTLTTGAGGFSLGAGSPAVAITTIAVGSHGELEAVYNLAANRWFVRRWQTFIP